MCTLSKKLTECKSEPLPDTIYGLLEEARERIEIALADFHELDFRGDVMPRVCWRLILGRIERAANATSNAAAAVREYGV